MEWMAWTLPTAIFFVAIGIGLCVMTLSEIRWPTTLRKGFLPLVTSRGDRFFVTLLASAFVHIAWLGFTDAAPYGASALCLAGGYSLLRWG